MKVDLTEVLRYPAKVPVQAYWAQIADSTFNLHKASPIHVELFSFSPSHPVKEYEVDAFKAFLPSSTVEIGDLWKLDSDRVVSFLHQFHPSAATSQLAG